MEGNARFEQRERRLIQMRADEAKKRKREQNETTVTDTTSNSIKRPRRSARIAAMSATPEQQRRARKRNEMLISAAADGDVGVVRVLLGMGPGATDASSKVTAMKWATSRGHNEVVQALTEAGA